MNGCNCDSTLPETDVVPVAATVRPRRELNPGTVRLVDLFDLPDAGLMLLTKAGCLTLSDVAEQYQDFGTLTARLHDLNMFRDFAAVQGYADVVFDALGREDR